MRKKKNICVHTFPGGSDSKESACNAGDLDLIPGLGRSPGEGNSFPSPVFLSGEFHGQRSLAGSSPWGCNKSERAEWLSFSLFQSLSHVWLFVATWTIVHQAPLSMGFYRPEYWRGLPFPPPGDLPDQEIDPESPVFPSLASGFFNRWATLEALRMYVVVVQAPSCVQLFVTPWTAIRRTSVSLIISRSLPKFMSIELVVPFNHLILWYPLLLLSSIFPSLRVFSSESALHIRWPKYWSFSFSISPSSEYSGLISFRIDWFDLFAVSQECSPAPQFKSINCLAFSLLYSPALMHTYMHTYICIYMKYVCSYILLL